MRGSIFGDSNKSSRIGGTYTFLWNDISLEEVLAFVDSGAIECITRKAGSAAQKGR